MAVIVDTEECVLCGACEDVCDTGAITMGDESAVVDGELCNECGTCVDECATEALSLPEE
ncbi:MAG: ferredoxin [Armatimonadetes bacterium CG2_30_59_28]|nr:4Fe-4S dicluster domain-containing protein [Armatimonadota bacterium]OIO90430.1 MAG: ferredoxin [Armatimonadetes bacterium CG2_30_59_28]PIU66134.1 MAG: ferredoxin [Armatimonadetes bacterium CG07_land_8_20_14_0_80_59_28]PIY41627.1 MAG: ferredoxin [Armatimonadetes bacterium CG_4_10_14_3_um_filter_59_10]PJB74589.1 MAG: ferredoxin [Armatimonadetes bacterium CG_4_9_14_3_um_filter_58_7]